MISPCLLQGKLLTRGMDSPERSLVMTKLIDLKQTLAEIEDITSDPDFENKPKSIRHDLLVRRHDLKQRIAIHMAKISRKAKT